MAAYAALTSLMQLIDALEHHHSPPISLQEQQVQSLTQHVGFLQTFLEGYTSPLSDIDDEADPLEIRIANAAYAAEDVIESYIVDKIQLRSTRTIATPFLNCFRGPKKQVKFYEDLEKVIEDMDLVKQETMTKMGAEEEVVVVHHHQHRNASASYSTSNMVYSEDVLNGILYELTGLDRHSLQVIPIVGMGGIGKTTLARYIYERPLIEECFDICVWVTVSQQYNARELLCELLSQATKEERLSEGSEQEVGLELHKYLFGRKFLVVMDDMWNIDAWDKVRCSIPNNENGSRILVTTRLSELSSQLSSNYSLQMELLDEVSSWDLFSKTVFGEGTCPLELEEIGKEIVSHCRGLPLSIVVVGGLLKKMEHTQRCWESLKNNLTSAVNLENDKHCLRLLHMSYNHLPVHLKACFLYMGVFEEDSQIRVSKLIWLWISEGFLKPVEGKSLEATAKGFFKDLVDRNLIIIDKLGSTGAIKYCKIHDLLRDLCMRESRKYEFYHVVGDDSSSKGKYSLRRVVIHDGTSEEKVSDALQSMSRTRSVICEIPDVPPCRKFGLVKTLYAHERYVNENVLQCVNLRHLTVKLLVTSDDSPSSFFTAHLFWNLHTLIVDTFLASKPPVGIWNMPQFKHIDFMSGFRLADPPSNEFVVMENLEILKDVENSNCGEEVVKRIPNVKKLGMRYWGSSDRLDFYCFKYIGCLHKLESLKLSGDLASREVVQCFHNLTFPDSLKKLFLKMGSEFEWEEMLEKIGSLPLLEKLELEGGSFKRGKKWEIGEGQFPCLIYLKLSWFGDLKYWTTEESSIFPRLQKLRLFGLTKLKEIPCEIGDIATLRKIGLTECSESAVMSVKAIEEMQVELQGEPLPFRVVIQERHKNDVGSRFKVIITGDSESHSGEDESE